MWTTIGFLGDMCDGWNVTVRQAAEDVELFARWTLRQRGAGLKVTVLAGTTTCPYGPYVGHARMSGEHTPVPTVTNAGPSWFCDTYTDGDGTMLLMDGKAFRIVR